MRSEPPADVRGMQEARSREVGGRRSGACTRSEWSGWLEVVTGYVQ